MRVSPRRLRRSQFPFGLHPIRPWVAPPKRMGWRMAVLEKRALLFAITVRAFVPINRDCRVGGGALARWPPSAAQTARTVFPYAAFTKTASEQMRSKELVQPG
jgi:hypothetical protein